MTTVQTDPVLEAVARKLHGIASVPPMEQAAMIKRAAQVARQQSEAQLREQGDALVKAAESALAGIWDGHYSGKGVTVEYAQAVHKEVGVKDCLAKEVCIINSDHCDTDCDVYQAVQAERDEVGRLREAGESVLEYLSQNCIDDKEHWVELEQALAKHKGDGCTA